MAVVFGQIQETVNRALHDKSKPWTTAFDLVEQKTGVSRNYIFMGATLFCAIYLIFGYGAELLCNIIGVAYPAYISIRAIESSPKDDDTKWLIYWVTYACLTLVEYFSVILTSIIPLYWLLKCCFLVWCMLPMQNNGSVIIYRRIVLPYFLKHRSTADIFIDKVSDKVKSVEDLINKKD